MKDMFKKSNDLKLYNVIFPVWLLYFFPITWLLVIPANFFIDSLVLVLGMYILKLDKKTEIYKKTILWVFLFGFASDFLGSFLLFLTQMVQSDGWLYEYLVSPVASNPFDNIYSLLYTFFAVIAAGIFIYIFNRFISFRKIKERSTKRVLALLLAVLTAPYFFLFPTESFYNGQKTEFFTNHIVWDEYINAEIYLPDAPDIDIMATEPEDHFDYRLVNAFRDGINYADRTREKDIGKEVYRIVFYKAGNDAKRLDAITVKEKNSKLYFEYDGKAYLIGEEYTDRINECMYDHLNPQPDQEAEK